jgi:pseudaminic acid biosynthesis-associated methylase
MPVFKEILDGLEVKKILEIGCNRGHNLISLSLIGDFILVGIEPQPYAILQGRKASDKISILEGNVFDPPFRDGYFDIVFTCCVLIHIHLKDLNRAIQTMYRLSNRYILIIEYFAEKEITIQWRGHDNALWKRDFEKHFLEEHSNLKIIKRGYLDKDKGFDRCHFILFEK